MPSVGRLNIPKSSKNGGSPIQTGPKSPIDGPRSEEKVENNTEYFSFPKKPASRSTSQHSNLSVLTVSRSSPDVHQARLPKLPAASTSSQSFKPKQMTNTEPAEMLSKLRQSLNSKTKSSSAIETALKNQQAINGVRESIEQKRISTNLGLLMLPPQFNERADDRLTEELISPQSSINGANRVVYDKEAFNNSYLSLGLAFLDSSSSAVAPAIFVNNEKKHLMKLGSRENFDSESTRALAGRKEDENSQSLEREPEFSETMETGSLEAPGERFEDPRTASNDSQAGLNLAPSSTNSYDDHTRMAALAELPRTPVDTRHGPFFRDDVDRVLSAGSFEGERRNLVGDKERLRKTTSSHTEEMVATPTTDIEDNYRRGLNDDYFKSPHESMPPPKLRNLSPIAIPPSLNAYAREPGHGSTESLGLLAAPRLSVAQYQLVDNLSKADKKPKRKPPPELATSASSAFTNDTEEKDHLSDCSSTKRLSQINLEDEYYYYSETPSETETTAANLKFPQFPSINERPKFEKKHSLFKKRNRKAVGGLVELEVELENETSDAAFSRSQASLPLPRSSTPVVQKQPVQLKTTMRKTNKRKEKKTAFNENKPWKNHSDLSFVTEQERKRYEGLWVSNKGNYMALVVTRLVGVDYDRRSTNDISEIEASTKAAQLSSKSTLSASDSDRLHELVSADVQNLAHGVVVKRIWGRSRLPNETLKAIWDLVDFRKDGSLSKAEFIVGMWLIDQTLYGRKLPKKVENSVWESLGSIGVSVVVKKKRR